MSVAKDIGLPRLHRHGMALVIVLAWCSTAQGQASNRVETSANTMKTDVCPITLREAVRMALTNNLDIAIQEEEMRSSAAGVTQELGAFDPEVSAEYREGRRSQELDTRIRSDANSGRVGIGGLLPSSTRYSADLQNASLYDPYRSSEEFNESRATVTLTQPLLEGRGRNLALTGLRVARRNLHITWLEFRAQVEGVVLDVERAYWDLIRARRDLEVSRKSVEAAETLLEQVRTRLEVDTASEADLAEAQSGLAQRRVTLIAAQHALDIQDRVLKDLVVQDLAAATAMLDPADDPEPELTLPLYNEALDDALTLRPELEIANASVENAADLLRQVKNERLPILDLEGSYGVNGEGGSFSSATRDGWDGDEYEWTVGLVFRKPWPDRHNRGAVRQQEAALRRQEQEARKTRRSIILEVGEAYDLLKSSAEEVKAGRAAVKFARLTFENEKARYDVQRSTVYDLLLRETDLLQAELNLYQSTADFRKNRAGLYRARGTLLEHWGIELERDRADAEMIDDHAHVGGVVDDDE